MAGLAVQAGGFNMDTFHLSVLLDTFITAVTPNELSAANATYSINMLGTGIAIDSQNNAYGVIQDFTIRSNDHLVVFDFNHINVPIDTLLVWIGDDANQLAFSTLLSGNDTVLGSLTDTDLLRGYDGDDSIIAGHGDDTVFGGNGNDTIAGEDTANLTPNSVYPDGSNYLRGDDGNDSIVGADGFDDINGNQGNDTALGSGGADWVVGGKGDDLLYGDELTPNNTVGPGDDIVWGNLGNDTLHGGDGNDQVRGGQGDDVIFGDAGNDFISGDRGNDTETGGSGADIFHGSQDAGIDRVLDFNAAEGDRVMLDPGTTYTLRQAGADTIVDMGGANQMILVGIQLSSLPAGWIFLG